MTRLWQAEMVWRRFYKWLLTFSSGSHLMSHPSFNVSESSQLLDLLLFSWDKLWRAPLPRSVSFSVKLMQISSLCLSNGRWSRALAPSRCAGVIVTFYLVIFGLTGCTFRLIPQLPPPVRADHTCQWIETSDKLWHVTPLCFFQFYTSEDMVTLLICVESPGELCIMVDSRFDNQKEDNVIGLRGTIKSFINFRFHRNSKIMAAPTLMTLD